MDVTDQEGHVRDSDGNQWECRWQKLKGHPIPATTRVSLRKPGTGEYTHFVAAPWPADLFKPGLIDRNFSAKQA